MNICKIINNINIEKQSENIIIKIKNRKSQIN